MTTQTPRTPQQRRKAAREITGLILAAVGLTGGLVLLATIDVRLIGAVACIAAIAVGAALTMSKE